MKHALLLIVIVLTTSVSCSTRDGDANTPGSGSDGNGSASSQSSAQVSFVGGYETDPRDRGRPVALIGPALGVTPETFRDAFSGVTPSRNGPPSHSEAQANKKVLLDALGEHGVTNERLDEVSDYYRYRRGAGEMWNHIPAEAIAIIENGKVTGFNITEPGSGYTTAPVVEVAGHDDLDARVTIEFSTDLLMNGRVTSIAVVQ